MQAVHRILLVDDDRPFADAIRRLLAPHVVEATTATAALAMLPGGGYDLAIIDVRMWPIDGLELAADMQRRGLTVPVLLVTGGDAARVRQMADDLLLRNVSDVLAKPINRVDLEAAVAHAVVSSVSERITRRALAIAVAPSRPRWP
ncbi:MAG: response regulator [Myxococcales bacterium]|nr:response regulator [Myxococcales bacterium]